MQHVVGYVEISVDLLNVVGLFQRVNHAQQLRARFLIDRHQDAGPRVIVALMAAGAVGLAVVAAGGRPLLIAGSLLAFAGGWGWSGLLTFVVVRANRAAAAAATGITHTGVYVGAALGPPLIGILAERASFEAAWWTTTGVLAAAAVLAAVAARMLRTLPSEGRR